jgi:hypothetical protein
MKVNIMIISGSGLIIMCTYNIIYRSKFGKSSFPYHNETFEKCSILFKAKDGEKFNHMNTLSILRIKI